MQHTFWAVKSSGLNHFPPERPPCRRADAAAVTTKPFAEGLGYFKLCKVNRSNICKVVDVEQGSLMTEPRGSKVAWSSSTLKKAPLKAERSVLRPFFMGLPSTKKGRRP